MPRAGAKTTRNEPVAKQYELTPEDEQYAKVEAAFAAEPLSAEQHELSGAAGLDGSGTDDGLVQAAQAGARIGRVRTGKPGGTTGPAARGLAGFYQVTEEDEKLNLLYYGREGSRKTSSALTATVRGPVLVINAEGGLKPSALKKHGVDVTNFAVWPDPKSGVPLTVRGLEALHEELLNGFHDDPDFLFAVVMDSFSEGFSVARDQAQEARVTSTVARLRKANKAAEADEVNPDFVDRDDYGVATNQFRKILRKFRDLPCHVIFTALEKFDEKEDGIVPAVSPAIRGDLLGMVDQVLYFRVAPTEEGEDARIAWRALTAEGTGGSTRGKDRYDYLPRVLVDPTFERILQYKLGELVEATDPLQVQYVEARQRLADEEAAKAAEKEAARAAREEAKKAKSPRTSRTATPAVA